MHDPLAEFAPVLELARRFVEHELRPFETAVAKREAAGEDRILTTEETAFLDGKAKEYGLWGIDVPAELGGMELPPAVTLALWEILGGSHVYYNFPPDAANLRMLLATADDDQRRAYLEPLARNEVKTCIAVSEPDAGGDPARMRTRAERTGDGWVLNGRKIWISNVPNCAFIIVMARTGPLEAAGNAISAFIVERDNPGLRIARRIAMIGGWYTYELTFDDCRLPTASLLGEEGKGFAPMAARLSFKRLQLAACALGMAQRALDLMIDYTPQRVTFGLPLSERQAVQWWVADGATQIHAARLMLYDAAGKLDRGEGVRVEASMVKVFAMEAASAVLDNAMQAFGAAGLSKDLPLHLMASTLRWMRVGEGPTEVHRMAIARQVYKGWRSAG